MAEPTCTETKMGTVVVNIPAAWKVEIDFTFRVAHRQQIGEIWKRGQDGKETAETYHRNDDFPNELSRSRAYMSNLSSVLTLEFSYNYDINGMRGVGLSELHVLTERKANAVTYTILASDNDDVYPNPPKDIGSSNMYVVVKLTDTKAPPVDPHPWSPLDGTDDEKPQLANIQAEIVPGLNKAFETFIFFRIEDVDGFRGTLAEKVIPNISTADKVLAMLKDGKEKFPPSGLPKEDFEYVGCSMGFSSKGLAKLGLKDYLYDEPFQRGQQRDAKDLGDKGKENDGVFEPDWDPGFLQEIHGIFQITSHSESKGKAFSSQLKRDFRYSNGMKTIHEISTRFRSERMADHEHFGFRNGIAKPEYKGYTFDDQLPMRFTGAPVVDPGLILMGRKGDLHKDRRPAWAIDGSFFVFRKLKQLVPEFEEFLRDEGTKMFPTLSPEDASHKLGARLFGRWKSGTPIALSPDRDDKSISVDDKRINDFEYPSDQKICPFAAHTQKSYPRNNLPGSNDHLIRRASIPYGLEVQDDERSLKQTRIDRGLIFLCYQSSIEQGFKYIQQRLSNPDFPSSNSIAESPGHDAVIGTPEPRYMTGANPADPKQRLNIHQRFVEARGGEYFFMPSMATLNEIVKTS